MDWPWPRRSLSEGALGVVLATAIGLAAMAMGPRAAVAIDLGGRATVSYQEINSEAGEVETEQRTINQDYLVTLFQQMSDTLSYRLNLRGSDQEISTRTSEGTTRGSTRVIEPLTEILLRDPAYDLVVGYRHRERFNRQSDTPNVRLTDIDAYSRLFYRPEGLPQLNFQWENSWNFDSIRATDTFRRRMFADTTYPWRDFNFQYNFTAQSRTDEIGDTSTDVTENLFNLNFNRNFFGDRLTSAAFFQVDDRREEDRTALGRETLSATVTNTSLGLTGRPTEKTILNYNFFGTLFFREPQSTRETFLSHGAGARYDFRPDLTGALGYQRLSTDSTVADTLSTLSENFTANVQHQPLKDLATSYSAIYSRQLQDGQIQTRGVSLLANLSGLLYKEVRWNQDLSFSMTTDFETGTDTDTLRNRGTFSAQFTKRLFGTMGYTLQHRVTVDPLERRTMVLAGADMDLFYRYSTSLSARATMNYTTEASQWTLNQFYSLDWLPYPFLSIFLSIKQVDAAGAGTSRTVSAQARWDITREMNLQTTFGLSTTGGAPETRIQDFAISFNMRF